MGRDLIFAWLLVGLVLTCRSVSPQRKSSDCRHMSASSKSAQLELKSLGEACVHGLLGQLACRASLPKLGAVGANSRAAAKSYTSSTRNLTTLCPIQSDGRL